jgi:hypothetical protein
MPGPRRQHHLAQAIQRNFLEPGLTKLWWYSREQNTYEERTTRVIAHARNTYTFSALSGDDRYALENAFSQLENRASPALRKLANREGITQDERNAVSELVEYQFIRTPSKIGLLAGILDTGASGIVHYSSFFGRPHWKP